MEAENLKQLIILDPHPDTQSVHEFQNPTFISKINDHIQEHIQQGGVYQ
jgi:hypothetical protein